VPRAAPPPSPSVAPPGGAPRWGLRDAVFGFLAALLLSAFVGASVLAAGGWETTDDAPMWAISVMQIPLWVGLAGATVVAARFRGSGSVRDDFGVRMRPLDAPVGLALGVVAQFALSYLLMWPVLEVLGKSFDEFSEPARELADKAEASNAAGVALFVVVVVVMAPLVEELFYRGLVHRSAVRLLGVPAGVALTSLAFGLAHGQLLQLLPLVGFGVVLSVLVERTGRLGPALWAHAGFNATTVVILLLDDGEPSALGGAAHAAWSSISLSVMFVFS